jgi:hypothetical protein
VSLEAASTKRAKLLTATFVLRLLTTTTMIYLKKKKNKRILYI